MDTLNEQRRIIELDLQQAQYEATLAERRYAACDPDNRLIAAQLERNWEAALRRVQACQARLQTARTSVPVTFRRNGAGRFRRNGATGNE
jgi:division protein CdvB (Snf7/Vps24/ESCRT-III family)